MHLVYQAVVSMQLRQTGRLDVVFQGQDGSLEIGGSLDEETGNLDREAEN